MKPRAAGVERARARRDRPGSTFLLAVFVLVFLAEPLSGWLGRWVLSAAMAVFLVAGVYALAHNRRRLLTALLLVVPALFCDVAAALLNSVHLRYLGLLFGGLFTTYLAAMLVWSIVRTAEVDADTIAAGLCVYLIIGLNCAVLYAVIASTNPHAIEFVRPLPTTRSQEETLVALLPRLTYYSFVTLTSLGLGDIKPLSPAARSLTALEAVVGQFYLAVLVSRLVGLHVARALRDQEGPRERS